MSNVHDFCFELKSFAHYEHRLYGPLSIDVLFMYFVQVQSLCLLAQCLALPDVGKEKLLSKVGSVTVLLPGIFK